MRTRDIQHSLLPPTGKNSSTLTKGLTRVPVTRGLASRPGKTLIHIIKQGKRKPHSSQHVRPRVSVLINDNQCVKFLLSKRLTGSKQTLNSTQHDQTGQESDQTVNFHQSSLSCTYCTRAATKERHKSSHCRLDSEIKICEQCFLCRFVCSMKLAPNVPNVT